MHECRVYANREHLSVERSPFITELCEALWSQGLQASRLDRYGSRIRQFVAVDSPQEADRWVLPLLWNYYLEHDAIPLALQEAQRAANAGLSLTVFSRGDFTAHLPFEGAILFEQSSYASRRGTGGNRLYAQPVFIPDYVQVYCGGHVRVREKGIRPVVGFCGQAGGSRLDFGRREIMNRLRQLSYVLKLRKWEPAPYETTRLRTRVLNELARQAGIQCNFLIRRRYRAGYLPTNKDPFHPTRMAFIQNELDSDYTVCVRGAGNFSVRFYETLALGRIPVFINTDCVLPYDQMIDYREYCVWVEENEIPHVGEKILAFHELLSPSQLKDLQVACHALWCRWLSMDGFYANFSEHFSISDLRHAERDTLCV